jgi:hypothetical protein
MLQGNFATKKVTSLEHETEKVEPSAFLPQKNKCLIDREVTTENRATNENIMDIIDSQKSTRKTAIARIGTMTDITDFSSLCINMDTVISSICASDEPQPIFRQILMNFVSLINNPDWAKWAESVGSMPLIHWYCYSFLKRIFNCFADFATDFGNGNIISESHPINELNTKGLVNAITAFKTFRTHVHLNQAQMTPIVIMPSSVAAYTIFAWNNTQIPPPQGALLHLLPPLLTLIAVEINMIPRLQTLLMTTNHLFVSRRKRQRRQVPKLMVPPRIGRRWECFTSKTPISLPLTSSRRICPPSYVQTLPAKGRNAPTLIVVSSILIRPVRFLVSQSLQSHCIFPRRILVGSTNTTS